MAHNRRRVAVAAVVATLLVQAAAGGVTAQSAPQAADDVYVSDDGDAVLVYESAPGADDSGSAEFGVSVAENLVYGLVTDSVEGTPDVRGRFSAGATPTKLGAEGGLSVPSPDALRAFALDVSSETTEQRSESDVSVDATVEDESGLSGFVNSVETSGEVTMAADRLTATAGLDVRTNVPLGERQSLRAGIAEDEGGYLLSVDRSRPVPERTAEQWRNRDNAERLLRTQYQGIAEALGGSAAVDVGTISVGETDTGFRLEQSYTVRFSGIDGGIESMVRATVADSPQLSSAQVEQLASGLAAVEIREASVEYTLDARDITGQITLDVRDYDDLALSYFEIARAVGGGSAGEALDRARSQFEAQQAADMERRFDWEGSLTHPESGVVDARLTAQSRATNWGGYVDELRSRDVPFVSQEFQLTGDLNDGRLEFDGSASMAGEGLFEQVLGGLPSGENTPESAAMLESVVDSNPEKVKLAASYDSDGLRIEGGAEFGELSRLRDALADEAGVPRFSEVVVRTDEAGGETVVRAPGAVSGQPSEESVRELPTVSESTTVHLPGEWDRDFPSMDVDRARNFLSDVLPGSSGPGFGPLVALVAILAAFGLLARRRP